MAFLGLLVARDRYQPGRGAAFPTYATLVVRSHLRRQMRRTRSQRLQTVSLDAPLPDGNTLLEYLPDPRDHYPAAEARALLDELLPRLSEKRREVLELCDLQGVPRDELAARDGVTQFAVTQRRYVALQRLRAALEDR